MVAEESPLGTLPGVAPRIKIGKRYGPYEGRIDPDAVLAYRHATNDPNLSRKRAGPSAPADHLSAPARRTDAGADSVEPGAIQGVRGGVHGEHDL